MLARFLKYFVLALITFYLASCGGDEDDPSPSPLPSGPDCSSLNITIVANTNAGCSTPGSIEVAGSGGAEPYTYSIAGSAFQSSGLFEELDAGNYSIAIRDANDCEGSLTVTVEEDENTLSISVSQTEVAGCGSSDGEIEVTLGNGAGDIEYSINGGDFSSDMMFSGLSADTYEITAKNADGCETTATAQVLTGITLSDHVQSIVTTNCALETCHGGSTFPDFRQKSNILNNASSIASRTANGSMPPSGTLDQELIDQIACWVEDGAIDN